MGLLVDGKWLDKWYDTSKNGGKFERQASKFRDNISNDEDARPREVGDLEDTENSVVCDKRTIVAGRIFGFLDLWTNVDFPDVRKM